MLGMTSEPMSHFCLRPYNMALCSVVAPKQMQITMYFNIVPSLMFS